MDTPTDSPVPPPKTPHRHGPPPMPQNEGERGDKGGQGGVQETPALSPPADATDQTGTTLPAPLPSASPADSAGRPTAPDVPPYLTDMEAEDYQRRWHRLTDLQARFVVEYLADPERNHIEAAIRAGYRASSARASAAQVVQSTHVSRVIGYLTGDFEPLELAQARAQNVRLANLARRRRAAGMLGDKDEALRLCWQILRFGADDQARVVDAIIAGKPLAAMRAEGVPLEAIQSLQVNRDRDGVLRSVKIGAVGKRDILLMLTRWLGWDSAKSEQVEAANGLLAQVLAQMDAKARGEVIDGAPDGGEPDASMTDEGD